MTNHIHLLLTPRTLHACALLMRNLGQRYVQYFNRRYERRGTLWEGRFCSCLVDSARYVIACHRYIELNPVRAGMVSCASAYSWSSHNGNAGRGFNELLTPHAEYLALAPNETSRHAAYEGLFAAGDEPAFVAAIRDATNGGFALVGEQLKARLPADTRRRLERKQPGPRPEAGENLPAGIQLEIGLRPRSN
jgi:putative transposase